MNSLKVVIPNGSMESVILGLLDRAGLPVNFDRKASHIGSVEASWIESVALRRPQYIPQRLAEGQYDLAVVGEDWIANWGLEGTLPVLKKLPIGRNGNKPIRIVVAAAQDSGITELHQLPRKCRVATEYVNLAKRFFSTVPRDDIEVVFSFGGTEHLIAEGEATAIVEVTESGRSLTENGLTIIHTVMESSTVVVANPEVYADDRARFHMQFLADLIEGAYQATQHVLIVANVPAGKMDEVCAILGGLEGPTYAPVRTRDGSDWYAVQSVVPKDKEVGIALELKKLGATGILTMDPIQRIMM